MTSELDNISLLVRFQILTATNMKMAVFCYAAQCSVASEVLTVSIIMAITLMMEAISTSETSANFY
jgi:hypothetical protein